jgi:hypothetical protein
MRPTHQKSLPLLLALLLAAPGLAWAATSAKLPDPSRKIDLVTFTKAPAQMVAEQLHELMGLRKSLLVNQDVTGYVTVRIENMSAKDAAENLRKALLDQAGVEILELPGEVMHVRRFSALPPTRPVMGYPPVVSWRFFSSKEPVEQLLDHIRLLTGKEIVADAAVQQLFGESHAIVLTATFRESPLEFVVQTFRETLQKGGGIVLDEQPDGSYHARLAAKPAPPAAPTPTPAAKQP